MSYRPTSLVLCRQNYLTFACVPLAFECRASNGNLPYTVSATEAPLP